MRFNAIAGTLIGLLTIAMSAAFSAMLEVPLPEPAAERIARIERAARRSENFQPSDGLSGVGPPSPYLLRIREALIGEQPYRQCQLLVFPSFRPEWAVYIVKPEDSGAVVVFKGFKTSLWNEVLRVTSDDARSTSYSVDSAAEQAALAQIKTELDQATAPITNRTVEMLHDVWWETLGRARYPVEERIGLDGTSYFADDWKDGQGSRSGRTWSPEPESLPGELVTLAERMAEYAHSPSPQGEATLQSQAHAIRNQLNHSPGQVIR